MRLLLAELRVRWHEHLLISLVIAALVVGLTVLGAVSSSAESSVHDLTHRLGKNMLVLPEAVDLPGFYENRFDSSSFPDSYPELLTSSQLAARAKPREIRLYGNVDEGELPVVLVGEGRLRAGPSSRRRQPPPARVGWQAAEALNLQRGKRFVLDGTALVTADISQSAPSGQENSVMVPLGTAQELLDRPGELNALRLAGCWCKVDVPALAKQVEGVLPGTRAVTVAGMIKAQEGSVAVVRRYSTALAALGFLLMAGLVGAVVASQVRRQLPELGLLLAIGARPLGVWVLFVIRGAAVGLLGAGMGILVAPTALREIGMWMLGSPLDHPGQRWSMGLLALCVLVSTLAAHFPAQAAARLDPATVLREG